MRTYLPTSLTHFGMVDTRRLLLCMTRSFIGATWSNEPNQWIFQEKDLQVNYFQDWEVAGHPKLQDCLRQIRTQIADTDVEDVIIRLILPDQQSLDPTTHRRVLQTLAQEGVQVEPVYYIDHLLSHPDLPTQSGHEFLLVHHLGEKMFFRYVQHRPGAGRIFDDFVPRFSVQVRPDPAYPETFFPAQAYDRIAQRILRLHGKKWPPTVLVGDFFEQEIAQEAFQAFVVREASQSDIDLHVVPIADEALCTPFRSSEPVKRGRPVPSKVPTDPPPTQGKSTPVPSPTQRATQTQRTPHPQTAPTKSTSKAVASPQPSHVKDDAPAPQVSLSSLSNGAKIGIAGGILVLIIGMIMALRPGDSTTHITHSSAVMVNDEGIVGTYQGKFHDQVCRLEIQATDDPAAYTYSLLPLGARHRQKQLRINAESNQVEFETLGQGHIEQRGNGITFQSDEEGIWQFQRI